MPFEHVAYVSTATKLLTPQEIDSLLLSARNYNQDVEVTGVLLCHKTTFFQFFEGRPEDVAEVYERIKNSRLHTNIFELVYERSAERYFNEWSMGFCFAPQSSMQTLADAQWQSQIPLMMQHAEKSFAIKMLQEFWFKLSIEENPKIGL